MKSLFLLFPIIALGIRVSAEQVPTEAAPTMPAGRLLPAEILSGTDYTIDADVPTDGFLGTFVLRTRFGDYQCTGREMLFVRLQELRALEQIDRVSKTAAFAKAITKGAIGEPVEAAVKIAKNPVGSMEQAPMGAAHLVGEVVGGFGDFGKSMGKVAGMGGKSRAEGTAKPPPGRDDPIGYNEARNEWAGQFGVDPYTTNRPLALRLNHLGMISFSMDKVSGAASGVAMGGLGPIADWLSYLPDVDEHLLTKPPRDVAKYNAGRLAKLGATKAEIAPLLDNGWFTPTLQTRFVSDLVKMTGVGNVGAAMGLVKNVQSEEQARFVCASLELLARGAGSVAGPTGMQTFGGMAAVTGADGTLLVAAPVDLLSWTEVVASFAGQEHPGNAVLLVNGALTDRARAGFASLGWKIEEPAR